MTFGGITTPGPQIAANYYVAINQLSAHNTASAYEEESQTALSIFAPLTPYTPFVLVALLFVVAFGILVVNKFKNVKNITSALLLAAMVAATPFVLPYITQGERQSAKAGPDKVPREVKVLSETDDSIRITWTTETQQYGTVRFGEAPLRTTESRVYVANNHQKSEEHYVTVENLVQGKIYEFEILSGTTWYSHNGSPIQFTF